MNPQVVCMNKATYVQKAIDDNNTRLHLPSASLYASHAFNINHPKHVIVVIIPLG